MNSQNTSNLSTNERLQELARNASDQELKKEAEQLSATEIAELTTLFQEKTEADQNEPFNKVLSLVLGLNDTTKLQAIGKSLSTTSVNRLLNISHEEAIKKRLSPLIVGITSPVFTETLLSANEQELNALKKEASTEPLQHHLCLLAQQLAQTLDASQKKLDTLYRQIQESSLDDIGENIHLIDKEAESLFLQINEPLQLINQALAIVWNTSRIDLITKFSSLKERYYKYMSHFTDTSSNTMNLHKALKEKLNTAFNENTQDSDAAIDALADFSIWYLQDYWEIGLLPHITNIEQSLASENPANPIRGQLFETAKSNLEKIGLKTLKDLKEAHIYSKKALQEFIFARRHLI